MSSMTKEDSARLAQTVLEPIPARNSEDFAQGFSADLGAMRRKEEEVSIAEMEVRLRTTIIEVLKPTVYRATRLQTEYDVLVGKYDDMRRWVQEIADAIKESKEQADIVVTFQTQLTKFWEQYYDLEGRVSHSERSFQGRFDTIERDVDLQKGAVQRLTRTLDRSQQEMNKYVSLMKDTEFKTEVKIVKNKELMLEEVTRIEHDMRQFIKATKLAMEEVWGPEDVGKIAAPSLRRLDVQMKQVNQTIVEVTQDITELRRLDGDVHNISRQQQSVEDSLKNLISVSGKLESKVEMVVCDTAADMKRVSNTMAAFSANLMKECRENMTEDLKHAASLREEVENYVKDSTDSIVQLDKMIQGSAKHAEAVLKEVRVDLETMQKSRRREKNVVDQELQSCGQRVDSAMQSAEATLKGLEHVSGIISMTLQSERMSVALDLQEFIDRKETPYVGISGTPQDVKKKSERIPESVRRGGLDPALLTRLIYKPQALTFAGTTFERPQLLALREKLVHASQEALLHGPELASAMRKGGANTGNGAQDRRFFSGTPMPPAVAQVLGAQADFAAAGRRSTTPIARPGSRGQPSARGSPMLEVEMGTPDLQRPDYDKIGPPPGSAGAFSSGGKTTAMTAASDGRGYMDTGRSFLDSVNTNLSRMSADDGQSRMSADASDLRGAANSVSPAMVLPKLDSQENASNGRATFAPLSAR